MIERFSQRGYYRHISANLAMEGRALARLMLAAASGKKINTISDDPAGAAGVLRLRSELSAINQYQQNLGAAGAWLQNSQTALQSISGVLSELRVVAEQGATDTYSAAQRDIMASEVSGLAETLRQFGNSRLGDHYLFSGLKILTPAFGDHGPDWYQGDDGYMEVNTGPGFREPINLPGSSVFGESGASDNVLDAVRDLELALRAGDSARVGETLPVLRGALEKVTEAQASLGVREVKIQKLADNLNSRELNAQSALTSLEGVDLPRLLVEFKSHKTAYEAYLGAVGLLHNSRTLSDYI